MFSNTFGTAQWYISRARIVGCFVSRHRVKVRDDMAISSPVVGLNRCLAYWWCYYSWRGCGTHSACAHAQLNVFTFIHLMFAHKSAHIILSTLYTCSWSVSESRCRSTTMLLFQINATILSCCGVCNDIVGHDHTIRALYISSLQVADGLSISATITVIELQT